MTPRKHLLCLYPWMEIGGADKFNLDLLACLRTRGWTSTVITTLPSRHPWRTGFERVAGQVIDLAQCPPEERPTRLLAVARAGPLSAILISHSAAAYRLLPFLRAELPQVPLVDYCHMEEMNWGNGGFPRLSLTAARWLDQQVVSSQHLKNWLCARGGESDRIAVCTTNIDLADWDPNSHDRIALRTELGIALEAPVALYAGRLVHQKQPVLAVSVMQQVVAKDPATVFLVAGDGPFAGYMRGFLRHHRLEKSVYMLGVVSNQRMRELLALSDIFFLPSKMEGISLAIYEAMAMAVVPVSAAVGGQAELVTPDCGILIPPGRNQQARYSAAILGLVTNRVALKQMGATGRQRLRDYFRLDQMCDRMEAAIQRAAELHRDRPRPPVAPSDAEAATRAAIAAARESEMESREVRAARPSWRRKILRAYWDLVDRGGWWLVPWVERARKLGQR